MLLGMGTMKLLHSHSELAGDLFMGGTLTATSVGITARVLRDLGHDNTEEARIILGAAVIDDVLCLIVLAVVSGLAITGRISIASIAITTWKGCLLPGRFSRHRNLDDAKTRAPPGHLRVSNLKLLFGVSFALLLAWLAYVAVLATIVGAFAAGMILNGFFDKEVGGISLHELLSPIESLIVPLFFVWLGIQVKLGTWPAKT